MTALRDGVLSLNSQFVDFGMFLNHVPNHVFLYVILGLHINIV